MKDVYLINYSVKGIKTLDQLVKLNFYKKTITKDVDTQAYNIKGIYGMNGSGKSAIVTSVDILKNILENMDYLNNPFVQKKLEETINKKLGELFIEAEFLAKIGMELRRFKYSVIISANENKKYVITKEKLSIKNATSKSESLETVFEVINGEITDILKYREEAFADTVLMRTKNLLSTTSLCAMFLGQLFELADVRERERKIVLSECLGVLCLFAIHLHVYLDQSDEHQEYLLNNTSEYHKKWGKKEKMLMGIQNMDTAVIDTISDVENLILRTGYETFEKSVKQLYEFLHIFKNDLSCIEIDKKEYGEAYLCNLVMVYDSYKIDAEFESTGIKKLIKLFVYLKEMVNGGIVFIDEFDSNLHDVYLCALLEYLMEYGEGQLCFTTHNVGPMDILKQNKKSIDFLSVDHKIYPWKTNGNYSPSKLYRNGMIEGSPFNVDAIDFIGVFTDEEVG